MLRDDIKKVKKSLKNIENVIKKYEDGIDVNKKNSRKFIGPLEFSENSIYTDVKSCKNYDNRKGVDFMNAPDNKDVKVPYDALGLAKYIISKYNTGFSQEISNLKLQKVLYYIQEAYILSDKGKAFNNRISAWQYGPVIDDVYYNFNIFGGKAIRNEQYFNKISIEDDMVNEVLEETKNLDALCLVRKTHSENTAWHKKYVVEKDRYEEITERDILDAKSRGYKRVY